MARYPLLDSDSIVVNISEMAIADAAKWKPPAGLTVGPQSDTAQFGDLYDGRDYVKQPPRARTSFLARDLVSILSAEDFRAIAAAAGGSAQIGLWLAMLYSRGEKPIDMTGETFSQAWGALVSVLGQPRADELLAKIKGV